MTRIVPTIHRMLPEIVEEAKYLALKKRPKPRRPIRNQEAYDKACERYQKLRDENPIPPWQAEMRRQLGLAAGVKQMKTKADPARKARERAEMEVETTVRKVVTALEIAMQSLNACRAPRTYDKRVNQQQIHNALHLLKTKCGIKFEEDEFSRKAVLDRGQFEEDKS